MKYYAVLISKGPHMGYRFYAGWDQIFTDRREAEKLVKEARAKFCGAKLASADEQEAKRLGCLDEAGRA